MKAKEVFEKYGVLDKVSSRNIIKERSTKVIADGVQVIGFPLEHHEADGSNIVNFGYIITAECDYGKHNILFVTDTHYIKYNLRSYKFHTIFIEANNMTRVIYMALQNAKTKGDKWKEIHFDRVLHSHMLAENTVKTLVGSKKNAEFDLSETDMIYLTHMTAQGSVNPMEIKRFIEKALIDYGIIRNEVRNGKVYKIPKVKQFQKNGELM